MILTDYFRCEHDMAWDFALSSGVKHAVIMLPEKCEFDYADKTHWATLYKKFTDFGLNVEFFAEFTGKAFFVGLTLFKLTAGEFPPAGPAQEGSTAHDEDVAILIEHSPHDFLGYLFHMQLLAMRIKKKPPRVPQGLKIMLASAYFPTQEYAVSWAMKSLTAEFGMGSGIPSSLWTPRKYENV